MNDEIKNLYPWANKEQSECIQFIWDCLKGSHHCFGKIEECGVKGVTYKGDDFLGLGTFDFSLLTYIVFEAHIRLIRVSIYPNNFRTLKITFHKRSKKKKDSRVWEYHPTLEQAIKLHKGT